MAIYIFQSEKDARYIGFTKEAGGMNLPPEFGPWRPFAGMTVPVRPQSLAKLGLSRAPQDQIERYGYCVMQAVPIAEAAKAKH